MGATLAPKTALLFLLGLGSLDAATTFYVSPTGNNASSGLTEATALATPQAAINKAVSGDTILLRGGNYPVGVGGMTFDASRHRGSDAAWLTIKNYPGEQPVFKWSRATAIYCAIWLTEATHVEISGLTLIGWNDEITLEEAQADTTASLLFNAVGIQADGRDKADAFGNITLARDANSRPHHFRLIGNTIRNFSGGGISFIQSDYLHLEGNTVENCSWYSIWAGSGISIWQAWNLDNTTNDYRIRLVGNRLFGNKALVVWKAKGYLSDGNGIIVDDFRNTQQSVTYRGVYTGRTLVANNLAVNNGGSGIHAYLCDNVDLVHNTAYHNGQVLDYGEIFALDSGNVRLVNNICVARPDRAINKLSSASTNVDYRNNIYFGGYTNAAYYSANNTVADPGFLNPALDLATADFRPGAASPAIDAGITALAGVVYPWVAQLTTDITGGTRHRANGPDIGAYEREGVPTPTAGLVLTGNGQPILAGDTSTSVGNDTDFASTEINLPAASTPVHTFRIVNRDPVSRTVSALTRIGSTSFSILGAPSLPLTLTPGANATFQLRFNPGTIGPHAATISLEHNSPATINPFVFAVSGLGVQRPSALVSGLTVSASLPAGATATHSGLVLSNRGSAALTWSADLPRTYQVADSLSPSGPAYQWIDISSTGTAIAFNNLNNSFSSALNIGFNFPYFGANYTQLCVNVNGHLSFDTSKAGNQQSRYRTPSPLATMRSGDNALLPRSIAALFDDLLLISGTSQVRYQQTDANTFVISWINVTFNADANKAANLRRLLTFQIILRRDGTITAQYQGVASPDGNYLIGIVNSLASSGSNNSNQFLQYAYTANILNPQLAVRYTPPSRALDGATNFSPGFPRAWANFSGAVSGSIAAGGSQTIPLVFNSTNLAVGSTYRTLLTLSTSDPDSSILHVPVSLTVGSTANLSPSVVLTAPGRSSSVQGIGTPLSLVADATDPDGSIAQVQFFDGDTLLGTTTTAPHSLLWVSTAAGPHTLSARATDNLGAVTSSQSVIANVVNLAPVVALTAPLEGGAITTGLATTLDATATDPDGTIAKVEFYAAGILRGIDTTAPFNCPWVPNSYGPVAIHAKAYDASGAITTSDPVNVTLLRPTVPRDGLLAHWRFNEGAGFTAADLSGNVRPATLVNATWNNAGRFGSAVTLDQTANAKVTFDHPSIGAFSFSAWVNGATVAGVQFPVIFSLPGKGTNGAGGYTLMFRRINTNDTLLRGISFNDGTGGDWQSWSTLTNDTWYHLVVTFDGATASTNGLRFYFNSVARADTTNYGRFNGQRPGAIATTPSLRGQLGNRADLTRPLAASLDQVRFYDRVLGPDEVSALYLDGGGPAAPGNFTATAGAQGIRLRWDAMSADYPSATYAVARATAVDGPFSPLVADLTASDYLDAALLPGTTYFYNLTAFTTDLGPVAGPAAATSWAALQTWRQEKFGSADNTGRGSDQADPDGDGLANLLEYALGGDPINAASAPQPVASISESRLQLTFRRSREDVIYTVEGSSTLAPDSWVPVPFTLSAVGELSTATDNEPIPARRFLRLRITAP